MAKTDTFPLVQIIQGLGKELREAQRRASKDSPILELRDCSIEVGVTWQKSGKAGVSFQVFELGGDVSKENTQTITLNLRPARVMTNEKLKAAGEMTDEEKEKVMALLVAWMGG